MTETKNYKGRSVDLEVLKTIASTTSVAQVDIGIVDTPRRVTGIQKLIQRFAVLALSELDSVKFAENQGGDLVSQLARGSVSSTAELLHLLHIVAADTVTLMMLDDNDPIYGPQPLDERILTVTFSDLSIDYATATAYATANISTMAGIEAEFTLPIS